MDADIFKVLFYHNSIVFEPTAYGSISVFPTEKNTGIVGLVHAEMYSFAVNLAMKIL